LDFAMAAAFARIDVMLVDAAVRVVGSTGTPDSGAAAAGTAVTTSASELAKITWLLKTQSLAEK